MEGTINERIKGLFKHLPYSQNEIAEKLSVSSSRIANITKDRNKPNSDLLINILNEFRNVNAYWLLLGEGEMFLESPQGENRPGTNKLNNNTKKGGEMIPDKTITALTEELEFLREMIRDEKHEKRELMDLIRGLNGGAEALRKEA